MCEVLVQLRLGLRTQRTKAAPIPVFTVSSELTSVTASWTQYRMRRGWTDRLIHTLLDHTFLVPDTIFAQPQVLMMTLFYRHYLLLLLSSNTINLQLLVNIR